MQPSLGPLDRMKVYEEMGDLCAHARIGFYSVAAHYYLQEVSNMSSYKLRHFLFCIENC